MDLHHEFEVSAAVEETWAAFLDMPRVAPCLPGAEITEVIDDRNVKGGAKVKVGPVNLRFAGTAEMVEIDERNRTALMKAGGADAKGRGNADADVRFTLSETGSNRTAVEVNTSLNLTGSVAQYGRVSGLIDEIANQLLDEFVANLEVELGGADESAVAADSRSSTADPSAAAISDAASQQPPPIPAPVKAASGLTLFFKAVWSMIKKKFRRS